MLRKLGVTVAVLAAVLMVGPVGAAEPADDGSVAWPTATPGPTFDFSEYDIFQLAGLDPVDPGEVAPQYWWCVDWSCYRKCWLEKFHHCLLYVWNFPKFKACIAVINAYCHWECWIC
jgi:hypothetical protein